MKKYDVIIAGAGNGGLAAGAVLAKEGKKVLVIEKSHAPGGFACSFRRGRFEFDVSLHELNGFGMGTEALGGVRCLFDRIGISDKIDWAVLPEAYRMLSSDKNGKIDAVMPYGIENYIKAMEKYAPGSEAGMRYIFSTAKQSREAVNALGDCEDKKEQLKTLIKNRDFLYTASKTVNEVLSEIDMPQRAKDILKGYWTYLGADCDNMSFFHYMMMVNTYIELGSVIPKKTSFEMTHAMENVITENGGELILNTQVNEIMVSEGRARGVKTAEGDEFISDVVIYNGSPHYAFSELIDKKEAPAEDLKRLNFRTFAPRGFCVYLGLDKSAEELGLKEYSYFIFPDTDDVKQYKNMGRPETNHCMSAVCPSAAYDASPEGTSIVVMTTLFTSDYWDSVKKEDYDKEKTAFADSLIKTFEDAAGVNLREHIEEIEIATPETFGRLTLNPHGAIYGYLGKKDDGLLARTLTENKRMTGIKGLYFVGGYAHKLNGYSSAMASGYDAARHILRTGGMN